VGAPEQVLELICKQIRISAILFQGVGREPFCPLEKEGRGVKSSRANQRPYQWHCGLLNVIEVAKLLRNADNFLACRSRFTQSVCAQAKLEDMVVRATHIESAPRAAEKSQSAKVILEHLVQLPGTLAGFAAKSIRRCQFTREIRPFFPPFYRPLTPFQQLRAIP
jgi:hypothetical protein